ncbi:MAG TPA: NADP-dependent oxidoreductase [Galbitalea sp.]
MARAVLIQKFGGFEVLEIVDTPTPRANAGELVIKVKAAGVNPVDSKVREGKRSNGPLDSAIGLGSDAAGVVIEVGDGVQGFAVGDEVIAFRVKGAYASHVSGAAGLFTPKPSNMSFEQGAAMGVPVSTAYQLLRSLELRAGQTLLVHAGSGGVGQAAIQFARLWGATVVATASPANHERLRELGAIPVAYGDGLLDRVRAAAPQGVDVVLDAAGTQEAIDASLALVEDPQRVGEIVVADWAEQYGVKYFSSSRPGFLGPVEQRLRMEAIPIAAELVAAGTFQLEIAASYPLDRVADAMRHSDAGHVRGKIVLIP